MTSKKLLFLASSALVVVACHGSKPADPPPPSGQGGFTSSTGGAPTTGTGGSPGTGAGPTTGTGGGTTQPPIPDTTAVVTMLTPLLTPLAQQHAPGAKAEGGAIGGFLMQGQSATAKVTLQPGKCYTGIAAGAPPMTDALVELVLDVPAGMPAVPALSESKTTGLPAVMAPGATCFRNVAPAPVPAVFRVTARVGSGPILGQLYVK